MGHIASWMRWVVWLKVVYCLLLKRWTSWHALQVPNTPRSHKHTHTHRIFRSVLCRHLQDSHMARWFVMTPQCITQTLCYYLCGQTAPSTFIRLSSCVSEVGWSIDLLPVCRSYTCPNSGIDFLTNCMRHSAHSKHPTLRPICIPSQHRTLTSQLSLYFHSEGSCCQQWHGQQQSEVDVNGPVLLITTYKRAVGLLNKALLHSLSAAVKCCWVVMLMK